MEIESQVNRHQDKMAKKILFKRLLLVLNCVILSIGNSAGPLMLRLYFLHGGKRVWLSCWLETAGWPIMFIPLFVSYLYRRRKATDQSVTVHLFFMTPFLFMAGAALGVLTGLDDYMYAYGLSFLPVSTSALIISSQLAFTALFAYLIVKQKFTSYSVNCIVLLTLGGVVLAVHTSSDRPKNESQKDYLTGFFLTLAAAALYGFVLPMVEFAYKKSKTTLNYTLVIEMQLVISLFATLFCTIGMLANKDFQAIPKEAREYGIGERNYYMVLVFTTIAWQFFFLGAVGVIFCASSLLSGIMIAVLLPLTEILAVVLFHEKFGAEKGIALVLSLWGFVSYFYGEMKQTNNAKKTTESEINVSSGL